MDNVYQHQKEVSKQEAEQWQDKLKQFREKQKTLFKNLSCQNTQLKYSEFCKTNQFRPEMQKTMQDGLMKSVHPNLHSFRDRFKEREQDSLGGIYLKTYLPDKIKSTIQQQKNQSQIFYNEMYNNQLPCNHYDKALRQRQLGKEQSELRFGLGQRTELENIQQQVQRNRILDHAERDTKMIYRPDWKPENKEQWIQDKTFNNYMCMYQGFKSNPPWTQFPFQGDSPDAYIDGFEGMAERQLRMRNKNLEHKRRDFCSTIQRDPWSSTLNISNSLRTYMQDKAFQVADDHAIYSLNNKFDQTNYKTALLKTHSVDRLVPYRHGQNATCQEFNNIRPAYPKIYRQSVKQFNMYSSSNLMERLASESRSKNSSGFDSTRYDNLPTSTKSMANRRCKDNINNDLYITVKSNEQTNNVTQDAFDFRSSRQPEHNELQQVKQLVGDNLGAAGNQGIDKIRLSSRHERAKEQEGSARLIEEQEKNGNSLEKQKLILTQIQKDNQFNKIKPQSQDDMGNLQTKQRSMKLGPLSTNKGKIIKIKEKNTLRLNNNLDYEVPSVWEPLTDQQVVQTVTNYFAQQAKHKDLKTKYKLISQD